MGEHLRGGVRSARQRRCGGDRIDHLGSRGQLSRYSLPRRVPIKAVVIETIQARRLPGPYERANHDVPVAHGDSQVRQPAAPVGERGQ